MVGRDNSVVALCAAAMGLIEILNDRDIDLEASGPERVAASASRNQREDQIGTDAIRRGRGSKAAFCRGQPRRI